MNGLQVRWSLRDVPAAVVDEVVALVGRTEHASLTGRSGLRFATWRTAPGEWFAVDYVFVGDDARARFQERAGVEHARISALLGREPEPVEACEVLAVAEGWDGFAAAARS